MSTAAKSGSRVRSKVATMELTPLLLLVEVTYFIPSAPLICCSSGVVTAVSTVCALAPTYALVTDTCGGARLGNCAIGKLGTTTAPARMISRAQTVANTGRRIKKSTNMNERPQPLNVRQAYGVNLPSIHLHNYEKSEIDSKCGVQSSG